MMARSRLAPTPQLIREVRQKALLENLKRLQEYVMDQSRHDKCPAWVLDRLDKYILEIEALKGFSSKGKRNGARG